VTGNARSNSKQAEEKRNPRSEKQTQARRTHPPALTMALRTIGRLPTSSDGGAQTWLKQESNWCMRAMYKVKAESLRYRLPMDGMHQEGKWKA